MLDQIKKEVDEEFDKKYISGIYKSEEGGWGYKNNCKDEIKQLIRYAIDKAYKAGREEGYEDGYNSTNPTINGYELTKKHIEQTFKQKKSEIEEQAIQKKNEEIIKWASQEQYKWFKAVGDNKCLKEEAWGADKVLEDLINFIKGNEKH